MLRRFIPWILLATLIGLATVAVTRSLRLRQQLESMVTQSIETEIQERVDTWETRLTEQLDQWIELASDNLNATGAIQHQLRKRISWFDSVYLWQLAGARSPATMIFPRPAKAEDTTSLFARSCLVRARFLTNTCYAEGVRYETSGPRKQHMILLALCAHCLSS